MNSVRCWFVFVAIVASLVAGQLREAVLLNDVSPSGPANSIWSHGHARDSWIHHEPATAGSERAAAATYAANNGQFANRSSAARLLPFITAEADAGRPPEPVTVGWNHTQPAETESQNFSSSDLPFDRHLSRFVSGPSQPFR
ncbi:MAG TPA: hypothetical protein VGD81_16745 [Opitutaceae bacterium]